MKYNFGIGTENQIVVSCIKNCTLYASVILLLYYTENHWLEGVVTCLGVIYLLLALEKFGLFCKKERVLSKIY